MQGICLHLGGASQEGKANTRAAARPERCSAEILAPPGIAGNGGTRRWLLAIGTRKAGIAAPRGEVASPLVRLRIGSCGRRLEGHQRRSEATGRRLCEPQRSDRPFYARDISALMPWPLVLFPTLTGELNGRAR